MATKPDKKPEWARVAEVDPVSGQNNYVEPSESQKDSGYDREKIPPRQWANWLFKKCGEWIGYFEEVTDQLLEDVGGIEVLNYLINDALYLGKNADISSETTDGRGLCFNDDYTKMYISDTNGMVYQYSLSEPGNPKTKTLDGSLDVSSELSSVDQIQLFDGGNKLLCGSFFTGTVYQYSLSSKDNIIGASYDSLSLNLSSELTNILSFKMSLDDTRLFALGTSNLYQYNISDTADISSGSYASKSINVSGDVSNPSGVDFSQDGEFFIVTSQTTQEAFKYSLDSPNELDDATLLTSKDFSAMATSLREVQFVKNGAEMILLDDEGASVNKVYSFATSRVVGA
jgi:hypothetical protein